jgi:hypothetical protein
MKMAKGKAWDSDVRHQQQPFPSLALFFTTKTKTSDPKPRTTRKADKQELKMERTKRSFKEQFRVTLRATLPAVLRAGSLRGQSETMK